MTYLRAKIEAMLAGLEGVTPGEWRVEEDTTLIWGDSNPADATTYGMGYPITELFMQPRAWSKRDRAPTYDSAKATAAHIARCSPGALRPILEAALQCIALEEKIRAVETCACSYDSPDEVCLHHSPQLSAALAKIAAIEAQIAKSE